MQFKAQNSFSQRKQKTHRNGLISLVTSGKSILQHGFEKVLIIIRLCIYFFFCLSRSWSLHPRSSSVLTAGKDPLFSESGTNGKIGSHGDPLFSHCGRILCFSPLFSRDSVICRSILCFAPQLIRVPCLNL